MLLIEKAIAGLLLLMFEGCLLAGGHLKERGPLDAFRDALDTVRNDSKVHIWFDNPSSPLPVVVVDTLTHFGVDLRDFASLRYIHDSLVSVGAAELRRSSDVRCGSNMSDEFRRDLLRLAPDSARYVLKFGCMDNEYFPGYLSFFAMVVDNEDFPLGASVFRNARYAAIYVFVVDSDYKVTWYDRQLLD